MLGITVPDAIALGTLVAGMVAMLRGGKAGDAAKSVAPPDPVMSVLGAGIVSTEAMNGLTAAVEAHTAAVLKIHDERRHNQQEHMLEVLTRLANQIEDREGHDRRNDNPRRQR